MNQQLRGYILYLKEFKIIRFSCHFCEDLLIEYEIKFLQFVAKHHLKFENYD